MICRFIGIDPGIANTGWAVVGGKYKSDPVFRVLDHGIIKTNSKHDDAYRLAQIYYSLDENEWVSTHEDRCMCIERVFFGGNVSSAISTGKVIGVCELIAELASIPTLSITPQQAKRALGDFNLDKKGMVKRINMITKSKIVNHHTADAAAIAMAGILEFQRINPHIYQK